MKNKCKGFTIVELVIVIAVIAVLAAVAIPTFSAIVKRANISADTQAARNMNIILASVGATSAPVVSSSVKEILKENGIGDFSPQTRFYTFYWVKSKNVILLADEGDYPVYPEEYLDATRTSDWHALDIQETIDLPTRSEGEDDRDPRIFTVTLSQSGYPVRIPFENILTQATEGREFNLDIYLPEAYRTDPMRYSIQKVTVIMRDGESEHKIELRSASAILSGTQNPFKLDEPARIRIPCVTGNIEINIDVIDYCIVTLSADNLDGPHDTNKLVVPMSRRSTHSIVCESLNESFFPIGYKIVSAVGTQNGISLGELYDKRSNYIVLNKEILTDDIYIWIETEYTARE